MLTLVLWLAGLAALFYVLRMAATLWVVMREDDGRTGGESAGNSDAAGAARQDPALRAALARADSAPPDRRRWALALADILLIRNGLPCNGNTLALELPADRREQLARQVLREMNLSADRSADTGAALDADAIGQRMQAALTGWIGGLGRSHDGFYEQLAAQGRVRDALAFDCARTAFLVRCIALLGWVPETQAWLVLFLNAQRAQDSFESWEDFGMAYARAREHWLRISQQDGPASTRAAMEVREHLRNAEGSWRALPWKRYRIFDPQPLST